MKKWLYVMLAMLSIVLVACGSEEEKSSDKKAKEGTLKVYTTVYPLQYFTEIIGGEHVSVQSIYPAGANEHTFEPTQKDMMNLADADVFFYIGLGLEGFVENAQKTLANENVALVATGDGISEEDLHVSTGHTHAEAIETHEEHDHEHDATEEESHDGHDHGEHDSHVWLSPVLSKQLAAVVKDTLIEKLPEQEVTFTANYEQLVKDLDALHAKFETMAAGTTNKTFFVSHAAFGYIAGHYGLHQVPVAGLNSQSEPSQKELTAIVDLAKKQNIKHIFFEQNVSSNLTEVIQKEIGAETLTLHNLSVLTNEDISNNETYFTLMEKNIKALKTALQ